MVDQWSWPYWCIRKLIRTNCGTSLNLNNANMLLSACSNDDEMSAKNEKKINMWDLCICVNAFIVPGNSDYCVIQWHQILGFISRNGLYGFICTMLRYLKWKEDKMKILNEEKWKQSFPIFKKINLKTIKWLWKVHFPVWLNFLRSGSCLFLEMSCSLQHTAQAIPYRSAAS